MTPTPEGMQSLSLSILRVNPAESLRVDVGVPLETSESPQADTIATP